MREEQKERWRELCALAEIEQDSEKLLHLIEEVNRLLEEEEKEQRLKKLRQGTS